MTRGHYTGVVQQRLPEEGDPAIPRIVLRFQKSVFNNGGWIWWETFLWLTNGARSRVFNGTSCSEPKSIRAFVVFIHIWCHVSKSSGTGSFSGYCPFTFMPTGSSILLFFWRMTNTGKTFLWLSDLIALTLEKHQRNGNFYQMCLAEEVCAEAVGVVEGCAWTEC